MMWVFYGPRAPEAKPASMASASKCESNIFRRPLVLAPAAVPAGSSFDSPGGASMARSVMGRISVWTPAFFSGAKNANQKIRAPRLDLWDELFFVLDKHQLHMLVETCFSIKVNGPWKRHGPPKTIHFEPSLLLAEML